MLLLLSTARLAWPEAQVESSGLDKDVDREDDEIGEAGLGALPAATFPWKARVPKSTQPERRDPSGRRRHHLLRRCSHSDPRQRLQQRVTRPLPFRFKARP